jgi:hypothetical protein
LFAGFLVYTRLVARISVLETKLNILWTVFARRYGVSAQDEEHFHNGGHGG